MTRFLRHAFFSAVLLASAVLVRAGVSYDESGTFTFDTRDYLDGLAVESATFSFDTRLVDGLSAAAVSGTFPFDTRTQSLTGLTITGPASVSSGAQASYQGFVTYSDGRQENVTGAAVWSVSSAAPAGTSAAGGLLQAGTTSVPVAAEVRASYHTANGQRTGALAVTIGGELQADFSYAFTGVAGNVYTLALNASSSGATGGVTYRWDTNNDGVFGDLVGQNVSWTINSAGGAYRVRVEATDSAAHKKQRLHTIRIDKPTALNQPGKLAPANTVDGGNLLDQSGQPFQFVQGRIGTGLIVMTHGLRSSGTADWLVGDATAGVHGLGASIEERLTNEGKPVPNLLIYDWGDDSDPNHFSLPDWLGFDLKASTAAQALKDAGYGIVTRLAAEINTVDFLTDIGGIRDMARTHGQILANQILIEANASPARVDRTKPVHLIGHSAGGFLMGECAFYLKQRGFTVDLVSMLDTPWPFPEHIRATSGFPNPGKVQRVVSSYWGTRDTPEGSKVQPSQYYSFEIVPRYNDLQWWNSVASATWSAHEESHRWYIEDTIRDSEQAGFYNSPFLHGTVVPRPPAAMAMMFAAAALAAQNPPAALMSGFSTFGSVSESGGVYTITEQADAGIYKEVTVPVSVHKLRFKFKFESAGDGDYLAVRFGERAEVFLGLDLEMTRSDYLEAEVGFGPFAGLTDKLVFTLVSRGSANAVLSVKDIEFVEIDDPDFDGLTTTQELQIGSNPQLSDTDGDGWDDAYEVNVSHTNPALADSDGDGQPDPAEVAAGTDPMDNHSVFAVTEFSRAGGGFLLRWTALPGKTYRIIRSTTPDFANFDVIASGIAGVPPTTTYTDTTINTVTTPKAFYRVEVE